MKITGKVEMPLSDSGSKFKTNITSVGTSNTDCYVVPANHSAVVKNLMLANANASARTFTVKVYKKISNTTTTIIADHSLATVTSESVFTVDKPLFLAAEDKVVILASHASSITATICAEEFFNPGR